MAAGDTFRAAASDQLEIWAERTGCQIVVAEGEKAKASTGANFIKSMLCVHFCISFGTLDYLQRFQIHGIKTDT